MKSLSFGLILFCLFIGSCKVDPQQSTLEFIIKGKYQDKPLVFDPNYKYDYFEGSKILFTKSEFFISDIELLDKSSKKHSIGGIYRVKLQNHHVNIEKANEGYLISIDTKEIGNFDGIRFGLGLNSTLNSTNPANYSAFDVLGDGENYWSGWNSYIFTKTEGQLIGPSNNAYFVYHSGSNTSYREIEIKRPLTLIDNQKTSFVVELDHQKIFGDSTDFVNIYEVSSIHGGNDFLSKFMDNFRNGFK
ncbi:MAG: MbnP family protein [Saprospiraceae bacterium]